MQTVALPANDTSKSTVTATGVSAANPLQLQGAGEDAETMPVKQNPFLRTAKVSGYNPLQLVRRTLPDKINQPVQLISAFSREVLEKFVLPLLEEAKQRKRDLPVLYIDSMATMRGVVLEESVGEQDWMEAAAAIEDFFDTVFSRYRLLLGVELLDVLSKRLAKQQGGSINKILEKVGEIRRRMVRQIGVEGYVEADPEAVDEKAPAPKPLLRGLIWNLHGFSNVINDEDRADFRVKSGSPHPDRQSMVNELLVMTGNQYNVSGLEKLKKTEALVVREMWRVNGDMLASLSSPLLDAEQKKAVYKFVRLENEQFPVDFAEKVEDKYRVKALYRSEVIEALESQQRLLGNDQKKSFALIDKLLTLFRANEVVHHIRNDYGYVSNLVSLLGQSRVTVNDSEPALLQLISKVKELRKAVKGLSAFLPSTGSHPLLNALAKLSEALNVLINRDNSRAYLTDDMNLAVYLDKELNKYAIVSHLTLLLKNKELNPDFMLLNEMNRGINSFSDEVMDATQQKYKVESGPRMAAMNKAGKGSQREYYPLVYNTQKFSYKGNFIVGVKGGLTVSHTVKQNTELSWMKPEKKAKASEDTPTDTYLDYRPIVVHRLVRKSDEAKTEPPQIWLAAVHTTPYGTEFERQRIFRELEGPLNTLKEKAEAEKADLIIGGDFYIAAEAMAKVPKGRMFSLGKEKNDKGMPIIESPGDQNQNRNLRNRKGEVGSFTKILSGDRHPVANWTNPHAKGIGLEEMRSVTGTNRNSKGLQSADYFLIPRDDRHRARVGLIDPRTQEIVELETDEKQISQHNFHFSDHLISAIELYASQKDRDKAQVHGRLKRDKSGMYRHNVQELKKDPRAHKYDIGDFEPQAGIGSIITTILFQVWSWLETQSKKWELEMDESEEGALPQHPVLRPDNLPKCLGLMVWIDETRALLKNRPYRSSDKERVSQLTAVLKSLGVDWINEYVDLIDGLTDHYPGNEDGNTGSTYLEGVQSRTLKYEKQEWGFGANYPAVTELPIVASHLFQEQVSLTGKIHANVDAGAVHAVLKQEGSAAHGHLIASLEKFKSLDEPEVIRQIGGAGLSVYLYRIVFFQENLNYYVNIFKFRYGRGIARDISILDVSSGVLQPGYQDAGFFLIG